MRNWKEIKLKTLISKMGDGGTPSTIAQDNFGGNIPWVVVEDVISEIYFTKDYLTKKGFNSCSAKLWDEGTIILTTGATIGNVGIAKTKLCTKQGITGIVCNEFANNYFLKYWFEANTNKLLRFSQGTTFKEIRSRTLGNLKIKIPSPYTKESVTEQKAIAAILSKVDEAITATQTSITAAERLKKSLMQNLLTGKLKPNGEWRSEDEFEETKIGLLPRSWLIKTVKELSTQVTDGEHYTPERSENGYYLLSARNIKNGYLALDDVDYVEEKELRRLQKRCNPKEGDILISCSGTIGNVCIAPKGLDAGMVRSAALVKLNRDLIEPKFAELVLQSFSLQNQMKVSVASSVQGNIFQGAIKKLKVPYPPTKEERTEIVEKIQVFSISMISKQNKIQTLQRLKKSLMQNLLTGKVRVDVEKIEELIAENDS